MDCTEIIDSTIGYQRRSGGVIRHSVDEIVRCSRGAAKAPSQGPGRSIKKNRQFLAKPAGAWYCFSERRSARLALLISDTEPGHRRLKQGTTRKWRRKPLKSRKMGSAAAGSRARARGRKIDQGEFRIIFFPAALPEAGFGSTARPASAFLGRRPARL
jgi:hypothetical protein